MIHSKRQKWVSILFSFVVMCVTAILGFVGLLQSAKPFSVLADDTTVAWELVTDASSLAVNDEVVIVAKDSDYALSTMQNSNNRGQAAITKNNDTITITDSVQILTIQVGKTDGTFAFYTGSGYLYAASSSKNHLKTETTLSANSSWSITIESANGVATVKAQGTYTRNWLKYNNNGNGIFSCYSSGQQDIQLYKKVEAACAHKNLGNITVGTPNEDGKTHTITGTCASCGAENVTKTVDCVATGELDYASNGDGTHTKNGKCECGRVMEGTSEACSMLEETVQYTKNDDGTHTKHGTCVCEAEVSDEAVTCTYTNGACECGRTAPKYTVTYSVWGETKATDEATLGIRYTLKTAADFSSSASYGTFVGWTTENVETSTSIKPTTYTEYDVTAAVTFYAVFSATQGSGDYTLVESVDDLHAGDMVVIAANIYGKALSTTQNKNNRGTADITKNDDNTITITDSVQEFILQNGTKDNTFAFNTGSGYLYAASSSSNHLKTESTLSDNSSWTIEIEEGTATVKAQGSNSHNLLLYNNSNTLFACYENIGSNGQTKPIQLYKKDGTTDYYTKRAAAIASASVSLAGDIGVNYFAQVLDESVSSLQMRFMVGEGTPTVVDGEKQTDGRYKFTLSLTPQCMADNIRAELLNGEVCIDVKDGFSVREYAKTLFEDEKSSDKLKALLSAMLRYGAAAQTYRNYNTEDLATRGVEDLLTAASATEIPEASFSLVKAEGVTKDDCAVWFKGAGIRFDSENKIYVRLSGALPEGYTLTCDGEVMTASADGYFYTAAISPTAYGNNYEFVLKNGGKVLQTLSGSINACLSMAANATGATDEEKELALALYNYGVAAAAYKA